MEQEFLNEERYNNTNAKVKKVGIILIIVGLVLSVVGIILLIVGFFGIGNEISSGFENEIEMMNPAGIFSSFGLFAIAGFMLSAGLPLTVVGLILRFVIGNRREIKAYATQQVMPVTQEVIGKMTPTISNAAKEITKGIKEGLNEADHK